MREVVNGLMYVLSTGCQWRAIPKDLPPKSTVYGIPPPSTVLRDAALGVKT
jgi:transposase